MNPYETRSREESRRVGKLVCTIEHVMRAKILCLVGYDSDGNVFITPQPGNDKAVLQIMRSLDFELALRIAEEHATGN